MNELNKKIIDFYLKSNQKKVNDFLPMFYDNPTNSYKVISVGLNPSLTEKFSNELESKKLTVEYFEKADEIEKDDGNEASNSSSHYAIRTGKPIVEEN